MKISTLCVLSLGLSLAVLSDAHGAKHQNTDSASQHHTGGASRHKNDQHHHHQNVESPFHGEAASIPAKPYQPKHSKQNPKKSAQPTPKAEPATVVPEVPTQRQPAPQPEPEVTGPTPAVGKKEKMVVAYWTDWTSGAMPPEAIPFDKVTHVNYAFSVVSPDFRPVFETDYLLNRVVRLAHQKNVKVLISIGGWTGSQYFSPLAASSQGRKTFIDGAVQMVKDNHLDGIDIDWEYPGRLGSACNKFDEAHDSENFLTLLIELRSALNALPDGSKLEISLATRIVPFDGPNGLMKDVSAFSKVVNHINVMAYDINGSWGTVTGANAPFGGPGQLNYAGGAQAWIDAGFPPQQINMGVPFYGRSLITQQDMVHAESMAAPFEKTVPIGDNNDGLWTDPCEKTAAYSGVWKYRNLREQGVIDAAGVAIAPWVRRFDEDSQTPWLFNPKTRQFISYDDRQSLQAKVEYAKQKDLGGLMLWAINQDTSDFELLDVLQGVRE
ncbi:hypothetical protein BGZ70_000526 [Mortierella alpina]|uniref:GH18 domain-containing protein n=1 Tax=Mortierella alpina TaxID=64518 RepID=A0A9P6JC79_MORAP|nr:hypothetical protein BGZ70_000526 [Mortierella alpina]